MRVSTFTSRAFEQVDNSWLAALRIMAGLVMSWSAARYLIFGWVERFYVRPEYFFTYPGFGWISPIESSVAMHAIFVCLVVLGLCVAAGLFFRFACVGFTLLFTWVWLIDVTNYLNHYYLLTILGALLALTPANRRWSVDSLAGFTVSANTVSRWVHWLFRAQVAIVYFYAGIAKLQPDWLLHGQPLNVWLLARTDYPIFGPLFGYWEVALAMSWAGFLFDLTIWGWLLWPRTRPYAYLVLVVFHAMTAYLFQIGIFPLIMTIAATVFFAPGWASRLVGSSSEHLAEAGTSSASTSTAGRRGSRLHAAAAALAVVWLAVQFAVPARAFAYGGNVLWHEQGMKWSWRVMVRAKYGDVSYEVTSPRGDRFMVRPSQYLTSYQEREMSSRPELILQLGHHIADEYNRQFDGPVAVRARTAVSLNSRTPAPILSESADLTLIKSPNELREIIQPSPETAPLHLGERLIRPQGTVQSE